MYRRDILKKEGRLRDSIEFIEREYYLEKITFTPENSISSLHEKNLKLKRRHEKLMQNIIDKYPKFLAMNQDAHWVELKDIQEILNTSETLLEYFVGDEKIYVFVIQKDSYKVLELEHDFPLKKWANRMRKGIEVNAKLHLDYPNKISDREALDSLYTLYLPSADSLYQKLVKPFESFLNTGLIIIPDGELSNIPFEALLTHSPMNKIRFKSYPFFIKQKELCYALSASLYHKFNSDTLKTDQSELEDNSLLMAPHCQENNTSLISSSIKYETLLHSKTEVDSIAMLLRSRPIYDSLATISYFKNHASKKRIIHISGHAMANKKVG